MTDAPDPLLTLLGRTHVVLVHFPIALLFAAVALEFAGRWLGLGSRDGAAPAGAPHDRGSRAAAVPGGAPRAAGLRAPAFACLLLGTLGAAAAAGTGWILAGGELHSAEREARIDDHRWAGVTAAGLATAALGVALIARRGVARTGTPSSGATFAARLALVAAAGVAGYSGHLGGVLVHGEDYYTEMFDTEPVGDAVGTRGGAPGVPGASSASSTSGASGGAASRAAGPDATGAQGAAGAVAPVDYATQIQPLLAEHCYECHGPTRSRGKLRLNRRTSVFDPAREAHWVIRPGDSADSELLRRVRLPPDDEDFMPDKGEPLTAAQIALLAAWIDAGAPWPEDGAATQPSGAAPAQGGDAPRPGGAAPAQGGPGAGPGDTGTESRGTAPKSSGAGTGSDAAPAQPPGAASAAPLPGAGGTEGGLSSLAEDAAAQSALAALAARGALAGPIAVDSPLLDVNFSFAAPPANDTDLALLDGLEARLAVLDLSRSEVTDAGLAALADCLVLERLRLDRTATGDAGLAHLARLPKLATLNLVGTAVTDAGLPALQPCSTLRRLYVWQTAVSEAGAQALAAALPELRIDRGVLPPAPAVPAPDALVALVAPCCETAKAAGHTCEHACCVAAAAAGKVCSTCGVADKSGP